MKKQCQRKGCGKEGIWNPVMLLYPPGMPNFPHPIRATLNLPLCNSCRNKTTLEELLSDAGWASIMEMSAYAGVVTPDRDTVLLDWEKASETEVGPTEP